MDLLSPWHLLLIFIVALLVFGPRRLPELGGALGRTIREFQRSMKDVSGAMQDEHHGSVNATGSGQASGGTVASVAAAVPGPSAGTAAGGSSPTDSGTRPS